jgi:hypothetical protein
MYHNKLVASLKANGKILREFKDTVYIPFGSEYSFLIKNLNTKRALVNVYIDGDNVVPGGLVLNAGQEVDLERSIVNGNLREGKHRGIKLEDGLVRIEYQFELYDMNQPWITNQIYNKSLTRGIGGSSISGSTGDWITPMGATYSSVSLNNATAQVSMDTSYNDVGITVPGSKSTQSFTKPVTVKQKPKCVTCGKLNKANAKFCSECGTALEIFA